MRKLPLAISLSEAFYVAACSASVHSEDVALAACAFSVPAPGADNVIEVQVTPAGSFEPSDGREMPVPAWRIDAAIASKVIERFNARKTPIVIDYEHQTLRKEENGQPAPAAGFYKTLQWREGKGLFATVELTKRARDHIASGEYKFFSPVFTFNRQSGDVESIRMGALTNDPGIDGMEPLALRAAATFGIHHEETSMNKLLAAVLMALGLAPTTSEDDAVAAMSAIKLKLDELGQLRQALGIADTVAATDAVAACTAIKTKAEAGAADPAKYVPVSLVEQLKGEIVALTAKVQGREIDELVQEGLADGRLLPAQETWARDLAKTNVAALTAYLKSAQPMPALVGSQTRGKAPAKTADANGLDESELAICTATGIKPEDYAKSKAAIAA